MQSINIVFIQTIKKHLICNLEFSNQLKATILSCIAILAVVDVLAKGQAAYAYTCYKFGKGYSIFGVLNFNYRGFEQNQCDKIQPKKAFLVVRPFCKQHNNFCAI